MKSVLVSFLERNKVAKCPVSPYEGDILFLKKEFRKQFSFEKQVSHFKDMMKNGKNMWIWMMMMRYTTKIN